MAKLDYIIFGDILTGQPNTISNPKIVFTPYSIPGEYSFGVMIAVTDIDVNKKHSFKFEFGNDQVGQLGVVEADEVPVEVGIDNLPQPFVGFVANMNMVNMVFKEPGLYMGRVFLDGKHLGNQNVWVVPRTEN